MVNLRNYLVTGLAAIALAGEGFDVTARAAEGKEEVTYQDYKIKKDDCYWAIGRANGISVDELKYANPGIDETKLQIGQTIKVPKYINRMAKNSSKNSPKKVNGEGASESDAARIILQRTKDTGISMMGSLYHDLNNNGKVDEGDSQLGYTLEPPWKENRKNESCIPAGEYTLKNRTSAKFRRHFIVEDVPDRDYVLIHKGNFPKDTHGCPLVGKTQSENYVGSSAKALDELLDKFAGKKNLKLTIYNPN